MDTTRGDIRPRTSRILSLDYLRGFFIIVIILDHFNYFPSLWTWMTGQGIMWVSAAEGFIIISGFLIGYIRGYKGLRLPFGDVAVTLAKRAATLYFWMIIMGIIYAAITWYIAMPHGMPWFPTPERDWYQLIYDQVTLTHPHPWIHFLSLYAIFLVLAIGFVWLLRRRQEVFAGLLVIAFYVLGQIWDAEPLKWQLLFFLPAIVGFHFESIRAQWAALASHSRKILCSATLLLTLVTIIYSTLAVYTTALPDSMREYLVHLFDLAALTPARVILAFVWFGGFTCMFELLLPFLQRRLHWLLDYFGTHSLTAYIAHGLVLSYVSYLGFTKEYWLLNTVLGALVVLLVYGFIRIPYVARMIPR